MPTLSKRTEGFTDSVIRRMTRISNKYGAVNLSQGFPDFEPPRELLQRLAEVTKEDFHQYSITWGAQNFREALAQKQSRLMGRTIDPNGEIVVTCGSTEAMMAAMMTVTNPGDKVIVFSPFYENYGADTILSGAEPIYVPLYPPEFNFNIDDLEAAFRQKPKALILCNPSNPCGKVFTYDELKTIADLAEKYDTYRKDRKFKSTNKGTITVEGGSGIYGWWLNTEPEGGMADYITELIEDGKSVTVDPIFYSSGGIDYEGNPDCWTAKDDIGNTYLEIDFYAQHMWFYKNGKKKWECDIVSGLPTEGRNTPEGVYKLWTKESPSKLKGENGGDKWETTVSYWNNISDWGTQIGIHDATWQPYFGGELYKWSGSHGCINVSYDSAKYVYENVPIGTPVVAYWD